MSSFIVRRLRSCQPPTSFAWSIRPSVRPAAQTPRYYATTTQGDTPNASNVSNPQSGSTQESGVKTSRAADGTPNKDGGSVQSPVSQGNVQSEGVDSPDNDEISKIQTSQLHRRRSR